MTFCLGTENVTRGGRKTRGGGCGPGEILVGTGISGLVQLEGVSGEGGGGKGKEGREGRGGEGFPL